jgi:pyridinium-3,5-bisthiocarboxylic acid mononucleotide nickel chelatase
MLLAALVDAGCPLDVVRDAVRACGVDELRIDVDEVRRAGMRALHLRMEDARTRAAASLGAAPAHSDGHPGRAGAGIERDLQTCLSAVAASDLPARVRDDASRVLRRLGSVEAHLHGGDPEHVHLHELSAADTMLDVVGVCAALDHLGVERVAYGPLPAGQGVVHTQHGALPLPSPATMQFLSDAGATVLPAEDGIEHVTPTAAALLTTLGTPGLLSMRLRRVGHGAGTRDDPRRPNVARCWLGDALTTAGDPPPQFDDACVELRTNLDDASPAVVADAMQRCLDAGALDAWIVPASMKKGRAGSILHVLVPAGGDAQIAALLLDISPTLGVRRTDSPRMVAQRDVVDFDSAYGMVRVKRKRLHGRVVDARPELDDCRDIATRTGTPLHQVVDTIAAAARRALIEDRP